MDLDEKDERAIAEKEDYLRRIADRIDREYGVTPRTVLLSGFVVDRLEPS
jgi:hypothetical protein